jgi:hypothetical protein
MREPHRILQSYNSNEVVAFACRAARRCARPQRALCKLILVRKLCATLILHLAFGGVAAATSETSARLSFSPTPIASDPKWAVTILAGASAGDDQLRYLMLGPWNADFRDNYFVGGAFSRRLARFWHYFSIEAEFGAGGRFGSMNTGEVWGAIYFRYDGFPWNRFVYTTFAISTGLNYLSRLPPSETHPGDPTSNTLHYFSPEFTFAHPQYKQHELLIRYHHRSGLFGTINGVSGGSNVLALGYRYRYD